MAITSEGYWTPRLSLKGSQVYNDYHRYLLVSGPKGSGKTLGVVDKCIRHAFDTDRARIGIFTKTIKVAKDGGCWTDLMDALNEQWIPADIGLQIVEGPKLDNQTRQLYCDIINRHGTTSRFVLNSLDYDDDIEKVIKGKRFSLIWFNELSNFKKRKVFDIAIDQLRIRHLPYEAHQFIADTNPSDEGEESWIYKLWMQERIAEEPPESCQTDESKGAFLEFQKDLGLVEIMIEDNPFITPVQKAQIYERFRHDEDLFARYCIGSWVKASTDAVFSDTFKQDIHIIGDISQQKEEDWDVLLPEKTCSVLLGGWDIGDVNHSFHIIEPALINNEITYKVLDEIVILGEQMGLDELAEMVVAKRDYWEGQCQNAVQWRDWSDRSAFDTFSTMAASYQHTFIYSVTNGRIALQAAPKYIGSLRDRIDLTKRLLYNNRLLVSARCLETITMFRALRKTSRVGTPIERSSRHKHPFDSLSYVLHAEEPMELANSIFARQGRASEKTNIVSMRM